MVGVAELCALIAGALISFKLNYRPDDLGVAARPVGELRAAGRHPGLHRGAAPMCTVPDARVVDDK